MASLFEILRSLIFEEENLSQQYCLKFAGKLARHAGLTVRKSCQPCERPTSTEEITVIYKITVITIYYLMKKELSCFYHIDFIQIFICGQIRISECKISEMVRRSSTLIFRGISSKKGSENYCK